MDTNKWGETIRTAVVEITGLPAGCPAIDSETGSVGCKCVPVLFEEFGALAGRDVIARLENFFTELGDYPELNGFIINYGTDKEIERREKQIREEIVLRRLDPNRVTIVRAGANPQGKRGVWTRVFIIPPGVDNPAIEL